MLPDSISSATQTRLAKLGIRYSLDLILHLPLRYEDETQLKKIGALVPGEAAQVQGEVVHSEIRYRPRRSLICQLQDDSGTLHLRFINFYPSQQKQLEAGKKIRALGEIRMGYFGLEMIHPKCRVAAEGSLLKKALTPVYPTTAGLPQSTLSKLISAALVEVELSDTLPMKLLGGLQLPGFVESVRLLHNPPPGINEKSLLERSHPAWQRIKFDELLAQQLFMRRYYRQRRGFKAPSLPPQNQYTKQLIQALPFSLTAAQQKTLQEISRDLEKSHPMHRLLQGDVGSGKTIVATLAALQAIENGYQVALMSPTEILAEQHYLKLQEWLKPLGINPVWLSGSLKKKGKQQAMDSIAQGETKIAIGTHALFQGPVVFHKLGLAIVDEQHKFGVQQRLALRGKGVAPHQLMMSATPIPRTLAMSYYADLDVSVIDELPPGRTPVFTRLVSNSRREEVFARMRQACREGNQAYWVCPLIDESETLQLQTVLETHQLLKQSFPDLKVGLVHGKLDSTEKARVMAGFKAGEIQLLVATTVIEVGVDIPNANLMIIEHAERMGLAQLHQLRGRIGRGSLQGMCILLFQQPLSDMARARLKIIYENTDGFDIAQHDLHLRGPGEMLGARQSGVPMLRFADVINDAALLHSARVVAEKLLHEYPQQAEAHVQRWMANRQEYLQA